MKKLQIFFEQPTSAVPLGVFRILVGLFSLVSGLLLYADLETFLGPEGWIVWPVSKAHVDPWQVHILDIHNQITRAYPGSELAVVYGIYVVFMIASLGLTIGFYTRFSALLSWVSFYILSNTMYSFTYGVDIFHTITLFYCVCMPVHSAWSIDILRKGYLSQQVSIMPIRVLQFHLCVVYLAAGGEKMLMDNWWNGEYIWYTLTDPTMMNSDFTWMSEYPLLVMALGWMTLLVEMGYPIFMWIPYIRVVWLGLVIGLHLFISLYMNMPMFGSIMMILSISAWGASIFSDLQKLIIRLNPRFSLLHDRKVDVIKTSLNRNPAHL